MSGFSFTPIVSFICSFFIPWRLFAKFNIHRICSQVKSYSKKKINTFFFANPPPPRPQIVAVCPRTFSERFDSHC
jgi:hypothetical protein